MDKSQFLWEEELKKLPDLSEEEIRALFDSTDRIENPLRTVLLNGMQKRLYDVALTYETEKIPRMDLMQEGNLALMEFLDAFSGDTAEFLPKAMEAVREAMQRFVSGEEESASASEALKAKLNVIDEITTGFAEKNGREPSAEELADLLQTDVSEIKYLLQIALDAIRQD